MRYVEIPASDGRRRLRRVEVLSDPVLVTRARAGDRAAAEALLARHEPHVRTLCRAMLGRDEADDAVQEALLRAMTRLNGYRGEAAFGTWLHRLTVNTCLDALRRDRRARARRESFSTDEAAAPRGLPFTREGELDPAWVASGRQADRGLLGDLGRLPEAQRRLIVLRDLLDLSYDEIAAVEGLPLGTVKCYLHRARAALRTAVEGPPDRRARPGRRAA